MTRVEFKAILLFIDEMISKGDYEALRKIIKELLEDTKGKE